MRWKRAGDLGYFYEPTVLAEIPKSAPAYREEVFGPVALFSRPGIATKPLPLRTIPILVSAPASGRTRQSNREFFSHELQSGMVFVNAMVASDPRVPLRDQTIRLRPRTWCRRDSRIYQRQDGLDRVRAALVIPSSSEGPRPSCVGHPSCDVNYTPMWVPLVVSATRDDEAMLIKTVSAARADA